MIPALTFCHDLRFSGIFLKSKGSQAVVTHAFKPSTWEAEAGGFEFEASLVFRVRSRAARATPCLETTTTTSQKA